MDRRDANFTVKNHIGPSERRNFVQQCSLAHSSQTAKPVPGTASRHHCQAVHTEILT